MQFKRIIVFSLGLFPAFMCAELTQNIGQIVDKLDEVKKEVTTLSQELVSIKGKLSSAGAASLQTSAPAKKKLKRYAIKSFDNFKKNDPHFDLKKIQFQESFLKRFAVEFPFISFKGIDYPQNIKERRLERMKARGAALLKVDEDFKKLWWKTDARKEKMQKEALEKVKADFQDLEKFEKQKEAQYGEIKKFIHEREAETLLGLYADQIGKFLSVMDFDDEKDVHWLNTLATSFGSPAQREMALKYMENAYRKRFRFNIVFENLKKEIEQKYIKKREEIEELRNRGKIIWRQVKEEVLKNAQGLKGLLDRYDDDMSFYFGVVLGKAPEKSVLAQSFKSTDIKEIMVKLSAQISAFAVALEDGTQEEQEMMGKFIMMAAQLDNKLSGEDISKETEALKMAAEISNRKLELLKEVNKDFSMQTWQATWKPHEADLLWKKWKNKPTEKKKEIDYWMVYAKKENDDITFSWDKQEIEKPATIKKEEQPLQEQFAKKITYKPIERNKEDPNKIMARLSKLRGKKQKRAIDMSELEKKWNEKNVEAQNLLEEEENRNRLQEIIKLSKQAPNPFGTQQQQGLSEGQARMILLDVIEGDKHKEKFQNLLVDKSSEEEAQLILKVYDNYITLFLGTSGLTDEDMKKAAEEIVSKTSGFFSKKNKSDVLYRGKGIAFMEEKYMSHRVKRMTQGIIQKLQDLKDDFQKKLDLGKALWTQESVDEKKRNQRVDYYVDRFNKISMSLENMLHLVLYYSHLFKEETGWYEAPFSMVRTQDEATFKESMNNIFATNFGGQIELLGQWYKKALEIWLFQCREIFGDPVKLLLEKSKEIKYGIKKYIRGIWVIGPPHGWSPLSGDDAYKQKIHEKAQEYTKWSDGERVKSFNDAKKNLVDDFEQKLKPFLEDISGPIKTYRIWKLSDF